MDQRLFILPNAVDFPFDIWGGGYTLATALDHNIILKTELEYFIDLFE